MTKRPYKKTVFACFVSFISQAIIVNFAPLLFLTFQSTYNIPLEEITVLVMVNFITQIAVDLIASKYVHKIGYRVCFFSSHIMCGVGLVAMAVLPDIINPFAGLIISTCIYAAGSGLIEVMSNPILDACPIENKSRIMSIMHSFYCWGVVGVIVLSTLFFSLIGIEHWRVLSCLWALIPLLNAVFITKIPIYAISEETNDKPNYRALFSQKVFWVIILIMLGAGASEMAISQWASTFVETGFALPKAVGDLIGVCGFAAFMGIARIIHAKYSDKISLKNVLGISALLCIIGYLLVGTSTIPAVGLFGCILCGFSVGVFWPGTISLASERVKSGGTTMFALCALGGDLGCSGGPALAGFMTGVFGGNLRFGILCATVFPILILAGVSMLKNCNTTIKE